MVPQKLQNNILITISTIQEVILKWFHKIYKQHPHYNIFNPTRDTQMGPKNLQNNIPFTISTIQKVILKWFHKNYNTTSPLKYPQSKR